LYSLLY
ncbi:thioredoxin family protein, partial [Vibrio cholerae HC-50A2]